MCAREDCPPASFHVMRHTWASLAVMAGGPLMVVARNLGHSDTRMVEKHYGHLAPSYVSDAIRAAAPKFGIKPDRKVVSLTARSCTQLAADRDCNPRRPGTAPAFRGHHHAERQRRRTLPYRTNIYDLVERAAVRRAVPRLELWQQAAKALVERQLPALNLSQRINPRNSAMTFGDWLIGFRQSVARFNDPNHCAHILRCIPVRASDFEKLDWRNNQREARVTAG